MDLKNTNSQNFQKNWKNFKTYYTFCVKVINYQVCFYTCLMSFQIVPLLSFQNVKNSFNFFGKKYFLHYSALITFVVRNYSANLSTIFTIFEIHSFVQILGLFPDWVCNLNTRVEVWWWIFVVTCGENQ